MKQKNSANHHTNNPFDQSVKHSAPFELSLAKYRTVTAIRKAGALSRIHIAELIGYSPSKITSVVNDLIADDILEETRDGHSTGGRRPREISFNPNFGYVVVVTIGVTKLDIALVDFNEHIRLRRMVPVNIKEGPDAILRLICDFVLERVDQLEIPINKIYAFGITVAGAVKPDSYELFDTSLMPAWGGYQLDNIIRQNFPSAQVLVENDANAMAYGELRKGAGREEDNFIYVKIGTSISAGIILNGQVYRGANGRAGDLGKVFVKASSLNDETVALESVASGESIATQATHALKFDQQTLLHRYADEPLTAREVGTVASEGDAVANQIIQLSGQIIGEALANLVTFFDPSLILIGGGVSNLGHQFLSAIRRSILARSPSLLTQNLRIDIAPLGSEASMTGAIALALENVFVLAS